MSSMAITNTKAGASSGLVGTLAPRSGRMRMVQVPPPVKCSVTDPAALNLRPLGEETTRSVADALAPENNSIPR